jgi:hypothetical protein
MEGADRALTSIAFIHRSYLCPQPLPRTVGRALDLSAGDVATHLRIARSGAIRRLFRIISSIIPSAKKSLFTCVFDSAVSRVGSSSSSSPYTRSATSTIAITRLCRALLGHVGLRCAKLAMVTEAPWEIAR